MKWRRTGVAVVLALVLSGCSGAGGTPPPSVSASNAVASSARATATPSGPPVPSCELPYVKVGYGRPASAGTAGFLKLPVGTFRADPTGDLAQLPSGEFQTLAAPVLRGQGDGDRSWDESTKRWLPVPSQQISPDGQRYVYSAGIELHLVQVTSGMDTILNRLPPDSVSQRILGYRSDGVYVDVPGPGRTTAPPDRAGIWLVDLTSPPPKRLLTQDVYGIVGDGVLWPLLGNTLTRIDLATETSQNWFSDPGREVEILGLDVAGLPLIWTFGDGPTKVWHVTGVGNAELIYTQPSGVGAGSFLYGFEMRHSPVVSDQHGVWFGASDGLFLYDAAGFRKVASTPGIPAGACG